MNKRNEDVRKKVQAAWFLFIIYAFFYFLQEIYGF